MYIYNLARFDFKVSLSNIIYFHITFYFINIKLSRIARNPPSTTISNCTKPRPLSLISVAAHPLRLFYSNLFIKKKDYFCASFQEEQNKMNVLEPKSVQSHIMYEFSILFEKHYGTTVIPDEHRYESSDLTVASQPFI